MITRSASFPKNHLLVQLDICLVDNHTKNSKPQQEFSKVENLLLPQKLRQSCPTQKLTQFPLLLHFPCS